ncbi:hypothetical protein [Pedobacter agri]|uniref:hypothetical protein n=1 Tax=Pedobacter agri TaxID=454586 RepID=UPI00292D446E|nr:hypothetical protein [Pedobacter agri]
MNFTSPIVIAELICLIGAFIFLRNDKTVFWKLNIAYLLLALLTEAAGSYMSAKRENNLWLYNAFVFFEIGFIFIGIYHSLKDYLNPKPILFVGLGIVYAIYFGFILKDSIMVFNSVAVTVMSVVFSLYCLYYYYLLLNDDKFIEIKDHPQFWWITGVLFYYFGGTVCNLLSDVFDVRFGKGFTLRYVITITLNLILYSVWTYSYTCRAKQRKLQS